MKLQPFSPVQVEPTVHLGPDEIIKSSGKYRDKPSKPSKNYCKEEIIIRNSDSGKGNVYKNDDLVNMIDFSHQKKYKAIDVHKIPILA